MDHLIDFNSEKGVNAFVISLFLQIVSSYWAISENSKILFDLPLKIVIFAGCNHCVLDIWRINNDL